MRQRSGRCDSMRSLWALLVVGGVLVLASAGSVAAQGYSTERLLPSNNNECGGIPGCSSQAMPAVSVPARGRLSTRFVCPDHHPHLWAWDVGLHEHIGVELIKSDRTSATIEGTNHADVEGRFVIYLGCSTSPYDGDSVFVGRRAAPTGWVGRRLVPRRP